jgi:RND family efflux transporter MFP subunit
MRPALSRVVWAALVVPIVLILTSSGCSRETASAKTENAAPMLSVKTVRVEPRPVEQLVEITGNLVSAVTVDVKTEVPGRLVSLLKDEGDYVGKGEIVARLDDSNAILGVRQAEANLETIIAALERAKVAEEHARIEDERARNLIKSGGITERDQQAAEMALKDARAQLRLIEAQIAQARQAVDIAKKRLSDCSVYSPISGEVEAKRVNQGTYLDGGAVLLRIVDNQRLELESYVASSELARLKEGQTVRFSVSAYPETFEARVKTISPAVESINRSIMVKATVPNAARKLKTGMFVRGWIVTGVKPDSFLVPADAVWRRPSQPPFVFVVEQDTAHKRQVATGSEQPDGIEITQGLKSGEVVVTEQYLELADGSRVAPLS